jgi:hypothetical protein
VVVVVLLVVVWQVIRSTCFGRLYAHHQELTTELTASGFTLERGGGSVVGRGLAGYPLNMFLAPLRPSSGAYN